MNDFLIKHKDMLFVVISSIFFIIVGYIIMFTPLASITSGESINVMDGEWFYKASYVNDTLGSLGISGRAEYTVFHIVDYFFLVSYCLVMMSLTKLVAPKKAKWMWVVFPLLPALFDLVENTLIEIASAAYPAVSYGFAQTIAVFTTLKWSLGVVWFLIFTVLLIIHILSILKKIKKEKISV